MSLPRVVQGGEEYIAFLQGMLLAAGGEKLALLIPDKEVNPGSLIS